jgi:hypothetical protein
MTFVYFLDNSGRFGLSVIVTGNVLFLVRVRRGWAAVLSVPFRIKINRRSQEY